MMDADTMMTAGDRAREAELERRVAAAMHLHEVEQAGKRLDAAYAALDRALEEMKDAQATYEELVSREAP
jgi:hypothetical protein